MTTNRAGVEMNTLDGRPTTSGSSFSTDFSFRNGKGPSVSTDTLVRNEIKDVEIAGNGPVVANTEEIALKALHVDDDPTLNPWTFRMYFLGIGLSAFGSALATIFLFKPQSVSVSIIFLTVISYVGGNAMALLPKTGKIGRFLNPHPFNSKEHLAIVIMSGSASGAARATEVLATQKLYYGVIPNPVVAILLLFSSQLLGYGMAGVLRKSLVYPTKMLWPQVLPLSSLIETLHRDKSEMQKKFKFFWIIFGVVAVWEWFPQYIAPFLTGISFFCLANRKSLVFTNIFGGSSGNEGLGVLALSFDWTYVGVSCFFLPLITLTNAFIGLILCISLYIGLYYGNVWNALAFPFLSQSLFSQNSTSTLFEVYNQTLILDVNSELDEAALAIQGLPSFAATNAASLLTTNLSITATIVHLLLWNFDIVKASWSLPKLSNLKKMASMKEMASKAQFWKPRQGRTESLDEKDTSNLDPHYVQMLAYAEVPAWWYGGILVLSLIFGLFCIYNLKSTLPWWGFLIAVVIAYMCTLFFGALAGLLGFTVPITGLIQLIGGYLHPGKPVANMYFVLFGANAESQALGLVENLKLGQYGKLSPKCTFAVQIIGTLLGAIINYALMSSITTQQREILLSIQGTNIWSGQVIQSFNSNAIAFGALSKYMFSIGRTYQWVVLALPLGFALPLPFYFLHKYIPKAGFDYMVTPVICWYIGYLSVGINSSVFIYFAIGFFVQFYVRKRHAEWFLKYNYLLAAAISGGTEMLVFITTFAVQGGSGKAVTFPPYWGNNFNKGNFDFCATNPALG